MIDEQTFKELMGFFKKQNIVLVDREQLGNFKIDPEVTIDPEWLHDEIVYAEEVQEEQQQQQQETQDNPDALDNLRDVL